MFIRKTNCKENWNPNNRNGFTKFEKSLQNKLNTFKE